MPTILAIFRYRRRRGAGQPGSCAGPGPVAAGRSVGRPLPPRRTPAGQPFQAHGVDEGDSRRRPSVRRCAAPRKLVAPTPRLSKAITRWWRRFRRSPWVPVVDGRRCRNTTGTGGDAEFRGKPTRPRRSCGWCVFPRGHVGAFRSGLRWAAAGVELSQDVLGPCVAGQT